MAFPWENSTIIFIRLNFADISDRSSACARLKLRETTGNLDGITRQNLRRLVYILWPTWLVFVIVSEILSPKKKTHVERTNVARNSKLSREIFRECIPFIKLEGLILISLMTRYFFLLNVQSRESNFVVVLQSLIRVNVGKLITLIVAIYLIPIRMRATPCHVAIVQKLRNT